MEEIENAFKQAKEIKKRCEKNEKALALSVKNIKILPATSESGAPELVADLVLTNQGNSNLLINFYHKPWIKAIEPKSLFRIETAIRPLPRMRMPDASDLIRIPSYKNYIYKYECWFKDICVGKPFDKKDIYHVLKSGTYKISFCFTSLPDENLEKYRKENEIWWKGKVLSSPAKFIFKK